MPPVMTARRSSRLPAASTRSTGRRLRGCFPVPIGDNRAMQRSRIYSPEALRTGATLVLAESAVREPDAAKIKALMK